MEKRLRQVLLYDIYGELLTKHQRIIYEEAINQDLSLSEIADEVNTSRQAVHDVIKRVDHILEDYEQRLGFLDRYIKEKAILEKIIQLSEPDSSKDSNKTIPYNEPGVNNDIDTNGINSKKLTHTHSSKQYTDRLQQIHAMVQELLTEQTQ
jgi:predicted DNA-binding protein YlxM (UPF0122 family)